jgi:hypothetical protein
MVQDQRADDASLSYRSNTVTAIMGPVRLVWIALFWPLISILLGILSGAVLGTGVTLVVFLLTLARTPLHMGKMLWVAATTRDVFEGQCYSRVILRFVVLLCVPATHVVFLVGVTATCATVGTLLLIGLGTKVIYQWDQIDEVASNMVSNALFRRGSHLGQYLQACQNFMLQDEESYPTLCFLKGIIAILPGFVVALIVFAPFSIAMMAITLYRLPINVYATVRIAVRTVLLKWDLRLVVLILLPFIHLLLPLVVLFGSFFGSFVWTWCIVGANVYMGKSIFDDSYHLKEALKEYHEAHVQFVTVQCHPYDHPSGIPDGWDGIRYGMEVERLLRWQRDLLVAFIFLLLELPTCIVVTTVVSVIMYIPSVLFMWKQYVTESCCCCGPRRSNQEDLVTALRYWPFHVIAITCLPVYVLACFVGLGLWSVLRVLFQVPCTFLSYGDIFDHPSGAHNRWCAAWMVQFEIIGEHDETIGDMFCGKKRLLATWNIFTRSTIRPNADPDARLRVSNCPPSSTAVSYWDRFASQCIHTTSDLLKRGWIDATDVQSLAPAAIMSIPAVAILTILADSVQDPKLGRGDIKWDIDGSICKEREHPVDDGIEKLMWPMVVDILRDLKQHKSKIFTSSNFEVLAAMICDNTERQINSLTQVLDKADPNDHALNNRIRTKINSLAMMIVRVGPYQSKMRSIFSYAYDEMDILEKQQGRVIESPLSTRVALTFGDHDQSCLSETTSPQNSTSLRYDSSSTYDIEAHSGRTHPSILESHTTENDWVCFPSSAENLWHDDGTGDDLPHKRSDDTDTGADSTSVIPEIVFPSLDEAAIEEADSLLPRNLDCCQTINLEECQSSSVPADRSIDLDDNNHNWDPGSVVFPNETIVRATKSSIKLTVEGRDEDERLERAKKDEEI